MNINIQLHFLIFVYMLSLVSTKNCFWNAQCQYKYFSSKTPYNSVRGDIRDSFVKLKGCEPISVWTLIRHGKRSPGVDFGRNMKDAMAIREYVVASYENGNSALCAQDVENLRDWELKSDLFEKQHGLTDEGYREIFGIGRRLKEAFNKLLGDLENGSYSIRSAYGHWVQDGVEGFVKGISNKSLMVEDSNPHYDIMAPYEACPKYLTDVKQNPYTYMEAVKYQASPEFLTIKQRIQQRSGIEYRLTNTNLTSLYDLCRYTWSGIDNVPSPWCALFTTEDLQVMEYYGDLRHYYRNGHGTPMNELFGRIPLADLYRTFAGTKSYNNRKLTAYFTHATMMDMAYSALGWYKDEIILTSVYRNPKRKWRSTKLSAFAGNLIAVLNRCSTENKEDYKVAFYVNEEPVTSICENGVCSWREFENSFKIFLNATMDFCSIFNVKT